MCGFSIGHDSAVIIISVHFMKHTHTLLSSLHPEVKQYGGMQRWLGGGGARLLLKPQQGQNNNALLNSWELQPVWKVELYGRYKCWRAFNPDGRSCLRPRPWAELPRGEWERGGNSDQWNHTRPATGLTSHWDGALRRRCRSKCILRVVEEIHNIQL